MAITLNVPIRNSVMDSLHQTSHPRPNSHGSSGYGSYHSLQKSDDDESDVKDNAENDKKDHKYKTPGNEGLKNIALRIALLVISVLLNIVLLCFIFAFMFNVKLISEDDEYNKQWSIVNSNSYALAKNCDQLSTTEDLQMKDRHLRKQSSSGLCQYPATKYLYNLLMLVRILSSLFFFYLFYSFFKFALKVKSRKYQGVFEMKSRVKTWQVRGIWSQ